MKRSRSLTFFSRFLLVLAFVVAACPALADPTVTPSTAPLAADANTLTINGTGFSEASVAFNNGAAGTVGVISATQLTVTFTTRPFPGNLTAVVTNLGQTSGAPVQVATVQPPVAQFYVAQQSALATDGTFSVTVNLSAAPNTPFVSGINVPTGVVYDPLGNLYVASFLDNAVYKLAPNGTTSTFASGLNEPWGLAFDTAGNLYVSNLGGNTVSVVTPAGAVSTFASGFNQPEGLAFDRAGNLYVANSHHNFGADGSVSVVTPAGAVTTFATGFVAPSGLAFDSAGNLYVANSTYEGTISEVTPGGTVSTFATGLSDPAGLAFDGTGNLYIANTSSYVGGSPNVSKATPGGQVTTVASGGLGAPMGLVFDPTGNLCVTDQVFSTVVKLFAAVTVPVTIGGSAVAGVDYSALTPSPLTFDFGQASATISGTLLLDPAATASPQTLSFTLGSPTGATLGSTLTDTVAILQPPVVQFGASSESVNASAGTFSVPATLIGQQTFAGGAAFTGATFGVGLSSIGGLGFDAAGNLYVANGTDGTIRKVTSGGVTSIFASGFTYPFILTTDAAGNCYVATSENVEKVAPNGTISTVASGIDRASGMVCDNAGNLYVACIVNGQWTILEYPAAGPSVTFASGFPSFLIGMAFGPDGYLYCGDQAGRIYKVANNGAFSLFASVTNYASGLAFDATGRLYVLDSADNTISMITPDGVVNQILSGPNDAYSLAFDTAGNLYVGGDVVTQYLPTVVVPFTLGGTAAANVDYTALDPSPLSFVNGQSTATISGTLIINPGSAKTLAFALGEPTGANLGAPATNTLTIAEPATAATVQFSLGSETINETAGTFSIVANLSGTATPTFAGGASPSVSSFASGFNGPGYVAFDPNGNAYVANNGTGIVSKVTPGGAVTAFASGFGATNGLAFDSAGNLYVASGSANSISKVTPDGSVSAFATGLNVPTGLAFDGAGNLYVANFGNNSVSEITPGGGVSTYSSSFNGPQGLAFDPAGNLYVANANDDTVSVVTPGGAVSAFATGFSAPAGLAFDSGGNLYVANTGTNTVSRVTPSGVSSILASGLTAPEGLAFDSAGNLYVTANGALDKLTPSVTVAYTLGGSAVSGIDSSGVASGTLIFAPNQTSATITGTLLPDPGANQTLTFTLNSPVGVAIGGTTTNTVTVVEPPPSVTASAASLPINGSNIVIQGIFNPAVANNSVVFNDGAAGTVIAASATSLTVALTTNPANVGALMASVTSSGQTTAATQVATVIPVVTPTASIIGLTSTTLTISGAGFDPMAANNTVVLSNGVSGSVSAATATQLVVTLNTAPTSTGNITAVVTTDGLSSGSPVTVAVIQPTVQFSAPSETVNATTGTFSVAATLTGSPSFASGATPTASTAASGVGNCTGIVSDALGNLYVLGNGALLKITPAGVVTTVAAAANFPNPTALAIDSAGNLYVSNYVSFPAVNNVIKVTSSGGTSTFVPTGAGLNEPLSLTCDSAGNVYVGQGDGSIIKVTPAGVMSTLTTGQTFPQAMAIDAGNNLYFASSDNTVKKVTPAGAISTFVTGVTYPLALAFDTAGNLYVSNDVFERASQITQVSPDGVVTGSWYTVDSEGLAFDPSGNLYFGNGTGVTRLSPTVSAPFTLSGTAQLGVDYTGIVSPLTIVNGQTTGAITGTFIPDPGAAQTLVFTMGAPTGASLGAPAANTMTIAEPSSAPSVQFAAGSETVDQTAGTFSISLTLTGIPNLSFAAGAVATESTFASNAAVSPSVSFLAFDPSGNLYVSDYNYGDISRISPSGVVTQWYISSGGYFRKEGMAFDTAGNLYISTFNDSSTGSVIKVTPSLVVTTFASGFTFPQGLAFDAAQNLYVACGDNTVQKVTPAGAVSTFASGFSGPKGIAFDPSGNLCVANSGNNTVSKVTPAGTVSSFATGFNQPFGIAVDSTGNLYVTNYGSGYVNKVTPAGVVSTISGLYEPTGIVFDSLGDLYVGSYAGNSVIKLAPSVAVQYTTSGSAQYTQDYLGPIPEGGQIVFTPGQATATLSGTLLADPGASKTLTIALNTPVGVSLGVLRSNTLTIAEPPPTVTLNTASLPINATTLTINGVFNLTAANNTVTFNNGAVGTVESGSGSPLESGSGSSLTVILNTPPNSVGPLLATVTADGQSSAPVQVATVVPAVTSATSNLALNATTLTINGLGFDPIAANNIVTFNNGASGIVISASASQLTIALTTPPTTTGILTVTVASDGNTSTANVPVATTEPIAEFSAGSESADASVSTFNILVNLIGSPTFDSGVSPNVSTFATGFNTPCGLAFDTAGNLYVANYSGDSVSQVTPAGVVSTFASGFPYYIYPTSYPSGLAFDATGNLYVSLFGDSSVSKVTPAGVISTFVSGADTAEGVAFDSAGNLYVTDIVNTEWVVSKITPGGSETTFTYTPYNCSSLAFDAAGNLYVGSDDVSTGGEVTKVSPDGTTSSLFASGFSGGPSAGGLALDPAGNLYVANYNMVSKITPSGAVSTLVEGLNSPQGLAFDSAGNLYVSTSGDNLVSKVAATSIVPFTVGGSAADGVDYTGLTAGPLVFVNGQPAVYITGSLLHPPGPPKTLTFALGTPSGAVLGATTTNTLTIASSPIVTSSTAILANESGILTINGFDFDPMAANNTVTFNDGTAGAVIAATTTQLTVQLSHLPTDSGALTAVVTTDGQSSGLPVTIDNVVTGAATTLPASHVLSNWATLNGAANPNGVASSYYFEYGLTTDYESSTTTNPAGNGTSAVGVGANIAGLAAGATYHYRLVEINSSWTAYGDDETLTTTSAISSPSWHSNQLTTNGNMASGSRTGAANEGLNQYYYKGTDGNLWAVYFDGAAWTQKALTATANVSDWVTFQPDYGYVYYQGTDNNIWVAYFDGTQWQQAQQTTNGNIASDIVVDTVWSFFYYRGTDGNVWADYWNGITWTQKALTTAANAAGSLSVDSAQHFIYYRSADNNMWVCYWNGSNWITQRLSTTANVGGAVTADADNVVYYSSSADNTAWAEYFNGTAWTQKQLLPSSSVGGATALYAQYTMIYVDGSGEANTLYFDGTNWNGILLGDGGSAVGLPLTTGLSVGSADLLIFCGRSDGNVVVFYYQ